MSFGEQSLHRSYLYAPASNPALMRKALRAGADAVIFDLEDAVAPAAKATARNELEKLLAELSHRDEELTLAPPATDVHVRINKSDDGYLREDIEAAVRPGVSGIRLPKAQCAVSISKLAHEVSELEDLHGLVVGQIGFYLIIESAVGALQIAELVVADDRVQRLVFGGQDLLADIGASGDDDLATLVVRTNMVLQSRAAGIGPPIDGVYTDLANLAGLRDNSLRGKSLGFFGRSILHPSQISGVHAVYTPTEAELSHARFLVDALTEAEKRGIGALQVNGEFIDLAIVLRAKALLAREAR